MTNPISTIGELKQDTSNPRKHNPRNLKTIVDSLHDVGFARSIVIDENNEILAGNGVTEAAAIAGIEKVIEIEADGNTIIAVRRRGLTDEQKQRLKYFDNRSGELAEWDTEQLLADMSAGLDLSSMFREDELDALLAELQTEPEPVTDAGAQVDKADALKQKWNVELGQLWALGEHKIICGDCTDANVVERLMGGEKADMVFTDPPYNVAYQSNESIESLKARNRRTDGMIVENDAMSDADFDAFLRAFLVQMPLKPGGAFYLCAPAGRTETQFRNALDSVSGLGLRECIVWVKDRFVFGRQDYHWRHESILYGWREGGSHYFVDDHTQDTVWEIARPTVSEFHPTMKPVELPIKAIANSSRGNEIVYEPFSGSGTTILACESLDRKARAIELSPAYVAVALQRWADSTNKTPVLVE